MRDFFCYYGGKWTVAKRYPKPKYGKIIEPFAGGAGYSLRYAHLPVFLYDIDPIIFGIWSYLIKVTPQEIRRLPAQIENVDDFNIPQEAKWLIGFWLNKGTTTPQKKPSSWMKSMYRPKSHWGTMMREVIASQVEYIKHWKIFNQSYENAPDTTATWFVDPPYCGEHGKLYRCKFRDFKNLSVWCKHLQGLVIACEQFGADWLPFAPFAKIQALKGSQKHDIFSQEVVWVSDSGRNKSEWLTQPDIF